VEMDDEVCLGTVLAVFEEAHVSDGDVCDLYYGNWE
jgi:hypothetical protein